MPTPIFTTRISIDWFEHLNLATLSLWCACARSSTPEVVRQKDFEFTKNRNFVQKFDSRRTAATYMQNQMLQY